MGTAGVHHKWLLVTGAPRSGTTFLNNALNTHPKIALFSELQLHKLIAQTTELVSLGSQAFRDEKGDIERTSDLKLQNIKNNIIREYFERFFEKKDLQIIGEKMPNLIGADWQIYQNTVRPCIRIIIVRRPDAVIASSMRRAEFAALGHDEWHVRSIEQAIVEWALNWEYAASIENDTTVLCVSYDSLIVSRDPIKAIAKFLNVEADLFDINVRVPTSESVLSAEDQIIVRSVLGDLQHAILIDMTHALRNFPRVILPVILSNRINISDQIPIVQLLFKKGFGCLEPSGIWTVKEECEIVFRLTDLNISQISFAMEFEIFFGDRENFDLLINESAHFIFNKQDGNGAAVSVPVYPDHGGVVLLKMKMPTRKGLQEMPLSDARQLGIRLVAVSAFEANRSAYKPDELTFNDRLVAAMMSPQVVSVAEALAHHD